MKPMTLNRQTLMVLDKLRRSKKPLSVYGLAPAVCERALRELTDPLLDGAGLRLVIMNEYRWFMRELAKLMRLHSGPDLAFAIEQCIRKWVNFGLEANTLQYLVCYVYERVNPAEAGSESRPVSQAAGSPKVRGPQ